MSRLTQPELENLIQEVTTLPERYENAPEFKDYIFGVLLLKRLSDAFEEEKEQIIRFYSKVGRRDEAAQLGEYKTEYDRTCFFVPESARWSEFQDLKSDLEKKLNKAAKAITADNPSLEGAIFPINLKIKDALLDKKLKEFISYLSRFQFRNEDLENIRILENIYRSYIQADGRQPNLELDHKRLYILSKLRFKNVHINRQNPITYIQNGVDLSNKLKDNPGFEKVNNINKRLLKEAKTDVQKFITAKNLHFLLGAGTSTDAIPVMSQLQTEFENKLSSDERIEFYNEKLKKRKGKNQNIEEILGLLYSAENISDLIGDDKLHENIEYFSKKIKLFLINAIKNSHERYCINRTIQNYRTFFKKITLRDKELSRVNIFTTNYDLLNEEALDQLSFNYNTGFSKGIKRFFNSARFHHTLSQQLDLSVNKYEPILDMIYLFKLHGSINWLGSKKNTTSLFDIEEINYEAKNQEHNRRIMIYPTPLKEEETLAGPYSDLMREFKSRLLQANSVLFVIGYSFSDQHINKIIYEALSANTSLVIFIFGNHINRLPKDQPRFYQLSQEIRENELHDYTAVHFFDYIVEEILPNVQENKDGEMLHKFVDAFNRLEELKES